jgi:hypothetical protein
VQERSHVTVPPKPAAPDATPLPDAAALRCARCAVLQVQTIEMLEPQGWVVIGLTPEDEPE